MWLAAFDLLLGARGRPFAAAMLLGCSGCGESDPDAAPGLQEEAGSDGDAAFERADDVRPDEARSDAGAHPADRANADVSSGDEKSIDVSVEAEKLAVCLRLMDPQDPNHIFMLSQTVSDAYLLLVNADCRVSGAVRPPGGLTAFADWRNALYAFNPDLWGCTAKPPTGFALLSTAFPGMSSADAALLIELYLRASSTVLALTMSEAADLRGDLQRLSGPLVTSESADYTFSKCAADGGAEADVVSPPDATGDAAEELLPDADAKAVVVDVAVPDAESGAADAIEGGD